MKILIVSGYFYPTITPRAFRTTNLALELAKQHDVTVYIPYSTYDYRSYEKINNIKIHFFNHKVYRTHWPNCMRYVKYLWAWLFEYPVIHYYFDIPKCLKSENNYDLLISIAAPHSVHWGCSNALHNNKYLAKVWVADCGDPFMKEKVLLLPHPFYFKYFEYRFCKMANYITIPVKGAKSAYYQQFKDKIRIIPQGFDLSKISKYEKTIKNAVPTFAYAGTFYKVHRDPRLFLDFLCTLNIEFKFVLYTKMSSFVAPYIPILKHKLVIRDFIPRDELLSVLSQMDFLVNFDNGTDVQSPSKLIDYIIANRPILNVSQDFKVDQILKFINNDYSAQLMFSNIDDYNIKNVANQFITLAMSDGK
jgi:hypothetical protein